MFDFLVAGMYYRVNISKVVFSIPTKV